MAQVGRPKCPFHRHPAAKRPVSRPVGTGQNKTCGDLQNRRTWDESGKKEGTDVHPEIPQDPATQTSRTSRTSQLNGRHWSLPEDPSGSPLDGVHGVRTQLLGQIRNPDETGISIEIILSRSMVEHPSSMIPLGCPWQGQKLDTPHTPKLPETAMRTMRTMSHVRHTSTDQLGNLGSSSPDEVYGSVGPCCQSACGSGGCGRPRL